MASSTSVQKIGSREAITLYKFTPGATTATDIAWVDMRNYDSFLIGYLRISGTDTTTIKILANAESDGSGTDVTVKTMTADPDAVDDYAFLEVTAQEVQEQARLAGVADIRYVTANCTNGTAGDEGAVVYVLGRPHRKYENLTADSIA